LLRRNVTNCAGKEKGFGGGVNVKPIKQQGSLTVKVYNNINYKLLQ